MEQIFTNILTNLKVVDGHILLRANHKKINLFAEEMRDWINNNNCNIKILQEEDCSFNDNKLQLSSYVEYNNSRKDNQNVYCGVYMLGIIAFVMNKHRNKVEPQLASLNLTPFQFKIQPFIRVLDQTYKQKKQKNDEKNDQNSRNVMESRKTVHGDRSQRGTARSNRRLIEKRQQHNSSDEEDKLYHGRRCYCCSHRSGGQEENQNFAQFQKSPRKPKFNRKGRKEFSSLAHQTLMKNHEDLNQGNNEGPQNKAGSAERKQNSLSLKLKYNQKSVHPLSQTASKVKINPVNANHPKNRQFNTRNNKSNSPSSFWIKTKRNQQQHGIDYNCINDDKTTSNAIIKGNIRQNQIKSSLSINQFERVIQRPSAIMIQSNQLFYHQDLESKSVGGRYQKYDEKSKGKMKMKLNQIQIIQRFSQMSAPNNGNTLQFGNGMNSQDQKMPNVNCIPQTMQYTYNQKGLTQNWPKLKQQLIELNNISSNSISNNFMNSLKEELAVDKKFYHSRGDSIELTPIKKIQQENNKIKASKIKKIPIVQKMLMTKQDQQRQISRNSKDKAAETSVQKQSTLQKLKKKKISTNKNIAQKIKPNFTPKSYPLQTATKQNVVLDPLVNETELPPLTAVAMRPENKMQQIHQTEQDCSMTQQRINTWDQANSSLVQKQSKNKRIDQQLLNIEGLNQQNDQIKTVKEIDLEDKQHNQNIQVEPAKSQPFVQSNQTSRTIPLRADNYQKNQENTDIILKQDSKKKVFISKRMLQEEGNKIQKSIQKQLTQKQVKKQQITNKQLQINKATNSMTINESNKNKQINDRTAGLLMKEKEKKVNRSINNKSGERAQQKRQKSSKKVKPNQQEIIKSIKVSKGLEQPKTKQESAIQCDTKITAKQKTESDQLTQKQRLQTKLDSINDKQQELCEVSQRSVQVPHQQQSYNKIQNQTDTIQQSPIILKMQQNNLKEEKQRQIQGKQEKQEIKLIKQTQINNGFISVENNYQQQTGISEIKQPNHKITPIVNNNDKNNWHQIPANKNQQNVHQNISNKQIDEQSCNKSSSNQSNCIRKQSIYCPSSKQLQNDPNSPISKRMTDHNQIGKVSKTDCQAVRVKSDTAFKQIEPAQPSPNQLNQLNQMRQQQDQQNQRSYDQLINQNKMDQHIQNDTKLVQKQKITIIKQQLKIEHQQSQVNPIDQQNQIHSEPKINQFQQTKQALQSKVEDNENNAQIRDNSVNLFKFENNNISSHFENKEKPQQQKQEIALKQQLKDYTTNQDIVQPTSNGDSLTQQKKEIKQESHNQEQKPQTNVKDEQSSIISKSQKKLQIKKNNKQKQEQQIVSNSINCGQTQNKIHHQDENKVELHNVQNMQKKKENLISNEILASFDKQSHTKQKYHQSNDNNQEVYFERKQQNQIMQQQVIENSIEQSKAQKLNIANDNEQLIIENRSMKQINSDQKHKILEEGQNDAESGQLIQLKEKQSNQIIGHQSKQIQKHNLSANQQKMVQSDLDCQKQVEKPQFNLEMQQLNNQKMKQSVIEEEINNYPLNQANPNQTKPNQAKQRTQTNNIQTTNQNQAIDQINNQEEKHPQITKIQNNEHLMDQHNQHSINQQQAAIQITDKTAPSISSQQLTTINYSKSTQMKQIKEQNINETEKGETNHQSILNRQCLVQKQNMEINKKQNSNKQVVRQQTQIRQSEPITVYNQICSTSKAVQATTHSHEKQILSSNKHKSQKSVNQIKLSNQAQQIQQQDLNQNQVQSDQSNSDIQKNKVEEQHLIQKPVPSQNQNLQQSYQINQIQQSNFHQQIQNNSSKIKYNPTAKYNAKVTSNKSQSNSKQAKIKNVEIKDMKIEHQQNTSLQNKNENNQVDSSIKCQQNMPQKQQIETNTKNMQQNILERKIQQNTFPSNQPMKYQLMKKSQTAQIYKKIKGQALLNKIQQNEGTKQSKIDNQQIQNCQTLNRQVQQHQNQQANLEKKDALPFQKNQQSQQLSIPNRLQQMQTIQPRLIVNSIEVQTDEMLNLLQQSSPQNIQTFSSFPHQTANDIKVSQPTSIHKSVKKCSMHLCQPQFAVLNGPTTRRQSVNQKEQEPAVHATQQLQKQANCQIQQAQVYQVRNTKIFQQKPQANIEAMNANYDGKVAEMKQDQIQNHLNDKKIQLGEVQPKKKSLQKLPKIKNAIRKSKSKQNKLNKNINSVSKQIAPNITEELSKVSAAHNKQIHKQLTSIQISKPTNQNQYLKIATHPKIYNRFINNSTIPSSFYQPKIRQDAIKIQSIIANSISFINYHIPNFTKLLQNQQQNQICLFVAGQWTVFKKQKINQLFTLESILLSVLPQQSIYKCIEMISGMPMRILKDKQQNQSNKRLLKSINTLLQKDEDEQFQKIKYSVNKINHQMIYLQKIRYFLDANKQPKIILQCKKVIQEQTNKKQIEQLCNLQGDTAQQFVQLYLLPNINYMTLQVNNHSINTYQIQLTETVLFLNGVFKFILYEQSSKNQYKLIKENYQWLRHTTSKNATRYLLIVEPIPNKMGTDFLTIKLACKSKNASNDCCKLISYSKGDKAQGYEGGYENVDNLYLPVLKEITTKK